jgi:hypothetical protein
MIRREFIATTASAAAIAPLPEPELHEATVEQIIAYLRFLMGPNMIARDDEQDASTPRA